MEPSIPEDHEYVAVGIYKVLYRVREGNVDIKLQNCEKSGGRYRDPVILYMTVNNHYHA